MIQQYFPPDEQVLVEITYDDGYDTWLQEFAVNWEPVSLRVLRTNLSGMIQHVQSLRLVSCETIYQVDGFKAISVLEDWGISNPEDSQTFHFRWLKVLAKSVKASETENPVSSSIKG